VLRSLADWWDSVELWITQLAFPFQVVLAIVVLLPLCGGVAVLADLASDKVDGWWARYRGARSDRPGS
jgi:phosphatidylglycerophosphate synthase